MIKEPGHESDLPTNERPRERFERLGPAAMAQRELLAILIQHGPPQKGALGLADELIQHFDGLAGLARAPLAELQRVHGMGNVKAVQLQAALELGRRMVLSTHNQERPQIRTPADAANLLMPTMGTLEQEEVHVLSLDVRNRVLGDTMVYKGSLSSVSMRVGEVFKEAIRRNAAAIVLAHNHPSNSPDPSAEDVRITKAIVQAGKLLDIECLDHICIAQNRYVSLKERSLGFD